MLAVGFVSNQSFLTFGARDRDSPFDISCCRGCGSLTGCCVMPCFVCNGSVEDERNTHA